MPRKLTAIIALTGIALAIALGLAACGESSSAGKESGTLRVTYASFPGYLDPALGYDTESYTAMYNTYIPLLTYAHANGEAGSKVVPGLAKALPKISDGGKTYTLFLRPGLEVLRRHAGAGVGLHQQRRTDVQAQLRRLPLLHRHRRRRTLPRNQAGRDPGHRDRRQERRDRHPPDRAARHLQQRARAAVRRPAAARHPGQEHDRDPPPATGPYAIIRSQPGKGWEYERNPQWLANNAKLMPDLPSGHVDKIDVTVIRNPSTQVNDVEQGKFDWMENPPPADRYAEIKSKYEGSQFRVEPQINTYYFWMNTTVAPFDDLEVRQAVNYAVDPAALERIYAGSLSATQQILPPGMPGYEKFELYPHDMAKAKQMIAAADPADREITVWTDSESPNDEAGTYYQDVLSKLGFDAQLKVLSPDNYFTVMGNTSTPDLDTGWTNWFEDYPHPNDFFQPLLAAESIQPTNNTNWSQIADPALSAKTKELAAEPLGPEQEAGYAELDREYMEQAPWAPYGTLTVATFVSSAIDLDKVIFNPTFGQDLTSFQFK